MAIVDFLRNAVQMVGQGAVVRLSGMLSSMVLTRLLGPSEFGTYTVFSNTGNAVYGLIRLGSDASVTVLSSRGATTSSGRIEKGRMLGGGLVLSLLLAVSGVTLCISFAEPIAGFIFGTPELALWVASAAALVFIQCLSQYLYAVIVGFQRFSQYASAMIWNAAFSLVFITGGAWLYGIVGAAVAFLLAQIISAVMLAVIVRRAMREEGLIFLFDDLKKKIVKLVAMGFPFYLSGLAMIPAVYYVQGMLVARDGVEAAGGLRIIAVITTMVSFIPTATVPVVLNHLSRAQTDRSGAFSDAFTAILKMTWIFSVLVGLGIALFVPALIQIIFGAGYSQYSSAAIVALVSSMFTSVLGVVSSAAFSKGRVKLILYYTAFQTVTFVAAAVHFVPQLGIAGYFLSEMTGYTAIFLFLFLYNAMTRCRVTESWHLFAFGASMVFVVALMSMSFVGGVNAFVIGIVAALAVSGLIFAKVLSVDERIFVKEFIRGRLSSLRTK